MSSMDQPTTGGESLDASSTQENANLLRIYRALDEEMWTKRLSNEDEKVKEAEHTAQILLGYADLPIRIRARACIVLAHSTDDSFIDFAREGVRIVEATMEFVRQEGREPGTADYALLRRCQRTLEKAERGWEDLLQRRANEDDEEDEDDDEEEADDGQEVDNGDEQGDGDEGGEEDEEEDKEDSPGLGEAIWTPEEGWMYEDKGPGQQPKQGDKRAVRVLPEDTSSNKSRRYVCNKKVVQEYNEAEGEWVNVRVIE